MPDHKKRRARIDFDATLCTLTPLHVGTGEFAKKDLDKKDLGKDEKPQVALLQRDETGAPLLPPTTLKGLMRHIGEALWKENPALLPALFGTVSEATEQGGQQGVLRVFMARRIEPVPDSSAMPFHKDTDPGVFIAARTALDMASGTADDAKLFFQEMVAPNTRFALRCRLEDFAQRETALSLETLKDAVLEILAQMTTAHGLPLGKGQADGLGRVQLCKDSLRLTRWHLDEEGNFVSSAEDTGPLPAPQDLVGCETVALRLTCEGPFVVMDSSHDRTKLQEVNEETPHIKAQRQTQDVPLLLGTSLSGALRARAVWLDRLDRLDTLMDKPSQDGGMDKPSQDGGESDRVKRLFGSSCQKALLSLDSLSVDPAKTLTQTSVKIDRFSAAPIDNALFSTEAFANVTLNVTLSLHDRGLLQAGDTDLFEALIADLTREGLHLGHGTNKGFGWFTVERR